MHGVSGSVSDGQLQRQSQTPKSTLQKDDFRNGQTLNQVFPGAHELLANVPILRKLEYIYSRRLFIVFWRANNIEFKINILRQQSVWIYYFTSYFL